MRRRDFVTLGGTAALAVPLHASAQDVRSRRLAVLNGFDAAATLDLTVLLRSLSDLGWQEGRNLIVERRHAVQMPALHAHAKELVAWRPDLIFAAPTPALAAVARETRTIPTVFVMVSAPDEGGFVKSIARPGGNITGFTAFEYSLGSKWLELLKEVNPRLAHVLVLVVAENYTSRGLLKAIEEAAPKLGLTIRVAPITRTGDIEAAISGFEAGPTSGLIPLPHPLNSNAIPSIVKIATERRIATIYGFGQFARRGGLVAYGGRERDTLVRASGYLDRILRGAAPADLPVQNPTHFELIINLKTASALGIEVPPMLLVRADEVIE